MYKVLFCGDRNWGNKDVHPDTHFDEHTVVGDQMRFLSERHSDLFVIHGAARGADTLAAEWALFMSVPAEAFPAYWNCREYEAHTGEPCKVGDTHAVPHGKPAGPLRNQKMIDQKPDLVVAFHDDMAGSKGTKDMVTKAEALGIPSIVINHLGEVH